MVWDSYQPFFNRQAKLVCMCSFPNPAGNTTVLLFQYARESPLKTNRKNSLSSFFSQVPSYPELCFEPGIVSNVLDNKFTMPANCVSLSVLIFLNSRKMDWGLFLWFKICRIPNIDRNSRSATQKPGKPQKHMPLCCDFTKTLIYNTMQRCFFIAHNRVSNPGWCFALKPCLRSIQGLKLSLFNRENENLTGITPSLLSRMEIRLKSVYQCFKIMVGASAVFST